MNELVVNRWRIMPEQNRLRRRGANVEIQPRCMALLAYLAERPGEVVDRQELFDRVWAGRVVGEDALNNCVRKLRQALDDDARQPRIIETVPGRGYRLKGRVRRPLQRRLSRPWLSAALLAVSLAVYMHGWQVSIYRFTAADSEAERQAKMAALVERIQGDDSNPHVISLRTHSEPDRPSDPSRSGP